MLIERHKHGSWISFDGSADFLKSLKYASAHEVCDFPSECDSLINERTCSTLLSSLKTAQFIGKVTFLHENSNITEAMLSLMRVNAKTGILWSITGKNQKHPSAYLRSFVSVSDWDNVESILDFSKIFNGPIKNVEKIHLSPDEIEELSRKSENHHQTV